MITPMLMRRLPILMLPMAATLLTACRHVEKNFAEKLIVAQLPSPNELSDLPLGETREQARQRFGMPYWISTYDGELTEQFSIVAKPAAPAGTATSENLRNLESTMTICFTYQQDASGIWRSTSLDWWQSGSSPRTMPLENAIHYPIHRSSAEPDSAATTTAK